MKVNDPSSGMPQAKPATSVPTPDIRKRGIGGFIRDTKRELKNVTWPSRAETFRLTGVVLIVCIAVIVFLFVLGTGFGMVLDQLSGASRG